MSALTDSSQHGVYLSIRNLDKSFGNFQVLQNVNLELSPGEFVAVVGKSGCGKSTLLRLIGGLDAPNSGEIAIDGQHLNRLNPDARIMFQDSRLLPWRKVFDNVVLGLRDNVRQGSTWALQQVGLGNRLHDWVTVLSGGQKQRVALARALVSHPRLLLLDEPLGALDALTRLEMQQLIQNLWQEQGFTVLLVTHDVEEAVYLADRVIIIEEGQIALDLLIDLPRPRSEGAAFSEFKTQILDRILQRNQVTFGVNSSFQFVT